MVAYEYVSSAGARAATGAAVTETPQPTPQLSPQLSPQPKRPRFRVNERVECRDHGETWQAGTVVSVEPLMVQPDGARWTAGYEWDEVRILRWEAPGTLFGTNRVMHIDFIVDTGSKNSIGGIKKVLEAKRKFMALLQRQCVSGLPQRPHLAKPQWVVPPASEPPTRRASRGADERRELKALLGQNALAIRSLDEATSLLAERAVKENAKAVVATARAECAKLQLIIDTAERRAEAALAGAAAAAAAFETLAEAERSSPKLNRWRGPRNIESAAMLLKSAWEEAETKRRSKEAADKATKEARRATRELASGKARRETALRALQEAKVRLEGLPMAPVVVGGRVRLRDGVTPLPGWCDEKVRACERLKESIGTVVALELPEEQDLYPKVGDTVLVLSSRLERSDVGREGVLILDDQTSTPYKVRFDDGTQGGWYLQGELRVKPERGLWNCLVDFPGVEDWETKVADLVALPNLYHPNLYEPLSPNPRTSLVKIG